MHVIKNFPVELPNFSLFVKKLLILSHGNATMERGFSIHKEYLVVNQMETSLVAQRLVFDTVMEVGGIKNVAINKQMILYARNAYGR